MKIQTVPRPYTLTFNASGHAYPCTSEEAQRVIDRNPLVKATRNRVQ